MAPGLATHDTNDPVVRSRAQMAGRARGTARGIRLLAALVVLVAAVGASAALAAPDVVALARSSGLVPVAHHDSFQVGSSGISVVGTYRDCSGRSPVGW